MALLLLLLFVVFGFFLLYSRRTQQHSSPSALPEPYLKGLNFLLNEQPDKAVDIFIDLLAVDEHTLETHLSLGNLFRRRGEIDRAIRVHQNVIARPQLGHAMRVQSLVALGEDYLSAGVLDRAERVFQEVMTLDSTSEAALLYLLDIYQQEKEWKKAIALTEKLLSHRQYQPKYSSRIAHYYCEIAELALAKQNGYEVQEAIKEALSRDPTCLRVHLVQADHYLQGGFYKDAIQCLKKIYRLNPRFLPEIFPRFKRCYEALNDPDSLVCYLRECMQSNPHSGLLVELIMMPIMEHEREEFQHALKEHLLMSPSLKGLDVYLTLLGHREEVIWIKSMVERVKKRDPAYQCQQCGYSGNIFQWQCPSCKRWGYVLPITY